MDTRNPPLVLLVEDNRGDAKAVGRVLEETDRDLQLETIYTGKGAENYLFGKDRPSQPLPDLIFLDFNLPGTDGRELLERIKNHSTTKAIPVVVLTSSTDRRDEQRAYEAGANSFVVKPADGETFRDNLNVIQEFWFDVASLPGPLDR